ncbi:MAG: dihydrodipicolinate reductase C-terminal domain-containing protein [Collinsella sp.]
MRNVETHHNQKVDAPSGTAKLCSTPSSKPSPRQATTPSMAARACAEQHPRRSVHSLRRHVAGVTVSSLARTRSHAHHRATSRQIFVNGALQPRRSSSPANPASIRSTRSCLPNQVSTESTQRRDSK